MLVALDLASTTGWAVWDDGDVVDCGVWDIAPKRGSSPGVRYLKLLSRLDALRESYPGIKVVAYERGHHRGGHSTEYALGYETHIQSWCARHDLEHYAYHTSKVKQAACDSGRASKEQVLEAARKRWPHFTFETDDQADACWGAVHSAQELCIA